MATQKTQAKTNANGLQPGLETWQEYAQSYTDFVVESTQRTLEQSLDFRKRMSQVVTDVAKKTQELSAKEQEVLLDAAEAFQSRVKTASERTARMVESFSAR